MEKTVATIAAVLMAAATFAAKPATPASIISFPELPYSEGVLYLSVSNGEKNVAMMRKEIAESSVNFSADLSKNIGEKLTVEAFQDLNDNGRLDFDQYGRPTEPCLRTTMTPTANQDEYQFKLIEY